MNVTTGNVQEAKLQVVSTAKEKKYDGKLLLLKVSHTNVNVFQLYYDHIIIYCECTL